MRAVKRALKIIPIFFFAGAVHAEFSSLNLGLDYRLRGIMTQNNDTLDTTNDNVNYYSHQARAYLTTKLNSHTEAVLWVQSTNIWGLEGSTSAPTTRYPSADGTPWVERAYLRMTGLAWNTTDITIGRQPILIGDGLLVSDDELGFNALRARVSLPKQMDLDLFTAKISEAVQGHDDFDLNGLVWGMKKDEIRWDVAWIQESNSGPSTYALAGTTSAVSGIQRTFLDIRLFGDLKDAYYKLEFCMQDGRARRTAGPEIALSGSAQKVELGAQTDTARFGRFGVHGVYASGTGDDSGSGDEDEAFRPTFGRRWSGLQRTGYGQHFAGTVSDAYDPSAPFSSEGTGLPPGASGIKTLGFGISTVQRVRWTGALDYYLFDSRTKVAGQNSLGAELDASLEFRYSGNVTFRFLAANFFPGDLYIDSAKVTRLTAETDLRF